MKRILHVVAGMNRGGTETYLMNIYRHIDRTKIQFDFLTYYEDNESGYFDEEIISLGGKIHNISSVSKSGCIKFIRDIRMIIKNENYSIVHAHTTYNIGFAMLAAELEGVELRIAHSHNTGAGKITNITDRVYRSVMRFLINKYANRFCACSLNAGKHLFSIKNIENNYLYLPNAVNLDSFINQTSISYDLKKSLNIPNGAKVIGHVGRYGKAKNHEFIVTMFSRLIQNRKDIYLILIGDGSTKKKIEAEIKSLGIEDNVKILGMRNDIANLMSIMDVFILPSHYEGFGIVLLEAQASGLPCIVSENIQPEPDMHLGLMHWVNLDDMEKWITTIENNLSEKIRDKELLKRTIEQSPFQLKKVVDKFYKLYEKKGLL